MERAEDIRPSEFGEQTYEMRYTPYRGLTRASNRFGLKFSAMNPKNPAKWK